MSENRHDPETPEGILVAVGGKEDKENDLDVLRKMPELINNDNPLFPLTPEVRQSS